jgi:phosphoribosyl 1,2-cyclic phosphate phosphodiesterase
MDDDFQVTFLGTGTSVGIPMIGCDCEVCQSTDPRDKRDRSSIHIRTPEAQWIVDTGPDLRHQCLREKITHLDAVLISHAHTDHIMGFDDLRRFTFGEEAFLPIHATAPTLAALKQAFAFAFDGSSRFIGYFKPDPKEIDGPFWIGETEITPLPVEHARVDTLGFLFSRGGRKRLAYMSDVKVIPPVTMDLIRGVEILVVDCLRHRPIHTHFTVEEALSAVADAKPGKAYFTHLCHELGHAEFEATLPPNIRVAYDGLKLGAV